MTKQDTLSAAITGMNDIRTLEGFRQGWKGGLPETVCGAGSTKEATKPQRAFIKEAINKYEIKSIVDVGAGDLNWVKEIDLTGVNYFPYDIIPRHTSVKELDITKEKPMKADLLMCLWVLNHMSDEDQQKALINIIKSRSIYILMTLRVGQLLPGLNIVESLTLNPEKKDLLIMYRNG